MGTEYTAWIGLPEGERVEEIDFFRDYNLARWLADYAGKVTDFEKCLHPGCSLMHRANPTGLGYLGIPTEITWSNIEYIKWALSGTIPERYDDPFFLEAVAELDKTEDRGNIPPRETLTQIVELFVRLDDLRRELRGLNPDVDYYAWPDERINLVGNSRLWIVGV